MEFREGLQPVAVAVLLYAVAWLLWRRCLSPTREDVEANRRAGVLLDELLSDGERRQLEQSGYLLVRSPSLADRVYRIPALAGWVDVFEWGRLAMRLCVQPTEGLPAADVVLMHKLMIEANEQEYLRTANVRWRRHDQGGRDGFQTCRR